MKKILSVLLAVSIIGAGLSVVPASAKETETNVGSTPHFKTLTQQINDDNTVSYYNENGKEVDIESLNADVTTNAILPSSYDLRDEGRVTSVKNQGSLGLCWDFGSTASMESNILSQPELSAPLGENAWQKLDLSEAGNAWYIHTNFSDSSSPFFNDYNHDTAKGTSGGFPSYIGNGLASGYGAYPEELLPYENWSNGYLQGYRFYSDYRLKNYVELIKDNDYIKDKLIKNGIATVHYNCYNSNYYYLGDNCSYYDSGTAISSSPNDQSHVVSIVGWDDNYSKENFSPDMQPSQNGAWLCKNSWDTTWGCTSEKNKGYFWMSYETNTFEITQFEMQSVDNFDNIYQNEIYANCASETTAASNVFSAKADEKLEQVNFACIGAVDCTIEVYNLSENFASPSDGQLLTSFTASVDSAGVYSIECPENVYLNKGDTFSVVVKSDKNMMINFRDKENGSLESGKGYVKDDSGNWLDVYDNSFAFGYAAIKAYTSNANGTDKTELSAIISKLSSEKIDDRVDAELKESIASELEKANEVLNNENASQNTVDNEYCLLKALSDKLDEYFYNINSYDDFVSLVDEIKNGRSINYILLNTDLDLSSMTDFSSLYSNTAFTGVFEGNGHTISGAVIKTEYMNDASFFGKLNDAEIKNTNFDSITVASSTGVASVLAVDITNSVIENCSITNSVITSLKSDVAFIADTASESQFANINISNCSINNALSASVTVNWDVNNTFSNVTAEKYTLVAQNSVKNNTGFSAQTSNRYSVYFPKITLTQDKCSVESFFGTIKTVTSDETTVTKNDEVFDVKIDNKDVYLNVEFTDSLDSDFGFTVDPINKTITILEYYGYDNVLNIPSEIGGFPVTAIADNFSILFNRYDVTDIVSSANLDSIGSSAFENCTNLKSVDIASVNTIKFAAFRFCPALSDIKINNVKTIETNAFMGDASITNIDFGNEIQSIGSTAFEDCSDLQTFNFGNSLETIESNAFSGCTSLKQIKLPNTLKIIDDFAFTNCSSIESVTIPDSVTQIGESAFKGCSIKTVQIGKNIESIGFSAFADTGMICDNDTPIIIHDFVVNGYSNTAAQDYAESLGLTFVDLNTQSPYVTDEHYDYSKFVLGDTNLDGKVNVADVTAIQKYLAKMQSFSEVQQSNSMVEYYRSISIGNATYIQRYLAGKVDSLVPNAAG